MSAALLAGEAESHVVNELPIPPIMFGVVALIVFMALLAFLWSFRNTLQVDPRHHHPADGGPEETDPTADTGLPASQKH